MSNGAYTILKQYQDAFRTNNQSSSHIMLPETESPEGGVQDLSSPAAVAVPASPTHSPSQTSPIKEAASNTASGVGDTTTEDEVQVISTTTAVEQTTPTSHSPSPISSTPTDTMVNDTSRSGPFKRQKYSFTPAQQGVSDRFRNQTDSATH
jgi:hypothetical protein